MGEEKETEIYYASYYDGDDGLLDIVVGENYNRFRITAPDKIACVGCGDKSAFIVCGPCLSFVRSHHSRENQKTMFREIQELATGSD